MHTYKTAEIAAIIGIHPNTVRLYEEWELISRPERLANRYRVFTDLHIQQFRLARRAFQVEVVQNGLRKKIVAAVKASAKGDYDRALRLAREYRVQLQRERANAEDAILIVERILSGEVQENVQCLKRREASEALNISMDALRNWEMNGLLTVKRMRNGYRVYMDEDIQRLKIIRALRCAGYSLEAILRMLCALSHDPGADIREALDSPPPDADIVTACDKLITSLSAAEHNADIIICQLQEMKYQYPPLYHQC